MKGEEVDDLALLTYDQLMARIAGALEERKRSAAAGDESGIALHTGNLLRLAEWRHRRYWWMNRLPFEALFEDD